MQQILAIEAIQNIVKISVDLTDFSKIQTGTFFVEHSAYIKVRVSKL